MKTLQVDKPVTSSQPQISDSKIYSGSPIKPYEGGAQHTRQPPETHYKIYSKTVKNRAYNFSPADRCRRR